MSYRTSEGDWTCENPECGNYNFAQRLTCNRCKREKSVSKKRKHGHEIGKSAAEKSHGLFSADDWQCEKCGNVNWARRNQCNVCNAPKVTTAEERTGVGGGYNERGNVEYKPRNESDEDYDEFGRRKKKRRHQNENNEKFGSSGGGSDDSNSHKLKDKKSDNGEKSNKNRMERREREGLKESERWKRSESRNDIDKNKDSDDDDDEYEKQSARNRNRRSVSSAASSASRVERHESRTKSKSVESRHDDYKKVNEFIGKGKESQNKNIDKVAEEEADDDDDDDDEKEEEEEEEEEEDDDDDGDDEDLSKYDLTNC